MECRAAVVMSSMCVIFVNCLKRKTNRQIIKSNNEYNARDYYVNFAIAIHPNLNKQVRVINKYSNKCTQAQPTSKHLCKTDVQ